MKKRRPSVYLLCIVLLMALSGCSAPAGSPAPEQPGSSSSEEMASAEEASEPAAPEAGDSSLPEPEVPADASRPEEDGAANASGNGATVLSLSSGGQKSITESSSFEASAGQVLQLNVVSDIAGGTVDFFLFSPEGEEQRFTFSGDAAESIPLIPGRWSYNCTGFFESGAMEITGTLEQAA